MITQKTIAAPITIQDVGLHSGKKVTLTIRPASAGVGIVVKRIDADARECKATVEHALSGTAHGGRQTTITLGDLKVQTIEHLMAAFSALGITSAYIELDNGELPALDGSSIRYVEEIKKVGIRDLGVPHEVVVVTEPIYLEMGGTTMIVLPASEFRVSYTLSYNHPSLSDQFVSFTINEETFIKELAPARTFCLKEEADALRAKGYGQGATYQNTLVFENNKPLHNTLRFPDEAARHKVVDLIGDLYLLGCTIKGHVITYRTGHSQNTELVKKLWKLKKHTNDNTEQKTGHTMEQTKTMDINQIMKILPHRYPFLLVDKVLQLEMGKKIVAIKNVTVNEPFFQGHFPGHPIMPGVLIVEGMAQAGGIVTMMKEDNPDSKVAYFMSIDSAKFRAPVFPGDQLRYEVEVVKSKGPIGVCACKAFVGEKLVCEAEVKFTIMDR